MRVGSLFAGIGGFELELDEFDTVWASEIDTNARAIYRYCFPDTELLGDIKKLKGLSKVDIVTGGFPCQDLSVAGRCKGLAGERSGLFWEIIRVCREIRPRWVFLENVPGLLSSNDGRDFGLIQSALGECGYIVSWRVLNSQYFRISQRRRRVFIVGSLGDFSCAEILFESEGGARDIKAGRGAGPELAYAVRANPSRSCDKGDGGINQTLVLRTHNLLDEEKGDIWLSDIPGALQASGPMPNQFDAVVVNSLTEAQGGPDDNDAQAGRLVPALRSNYWNNSNPITEANMLIWQNKQQSGEIREYNNVCPTVSKYFGIGGNNVPLYGVRRLTPRECERLQGFSDDWTRWGINENGEKIEIFDSARYRCLGNAVTVNVISWIGRRIMEFENGKDERLADNGARGE